MERRKSICINFIYGIALFYLVFKAFFYYSEVDWGPDEKAHLSYIYYEYSHPGELVPDFEEIHMVDFKVVEDKAYVQGLAEDICYLGHPPLYYMLMNWLGCVQTEGDSVYMDMYRVLICNISLVALGLALCMAVGYRKIADMSNSLLSHALFATIIVSLPMVAYVGAGASNDNILYLAMGILLIGLERGVSGKRDCLTYWIIVLGVLMAVLSKLTLGLIALIAMVFVVLYIMISEKSIKVLWCKEFATTLPVYLCILGYFVRNLMKYGAVHPGLGLISPESFANSEFAVGNDLNMSFAEAIDYFWRHFWWSWSTIYSHTVSLDKYGTMAEAIYWLIPLGAVLFLAVMLLAVLRKKSLSFELVISAFVIGNVATFIYQMIGRCQGYVRGGGLRGYQARYYICCIGIFALCNALLFEKIKQWGKCGRIIRACVDLAEAVLIIGFIYYDFFYFVTHFSDYRAYL